jgi:hypothetical protein
MAVANTDTTLPLATVTVEIQLISRKEVEANAQDIYRVKATAVIHGRDFGPDSKQDKGTWGMSIDYGSGTNMKIGARRISPIVVAEVPAQTSFTIHVFVDGGLKPIHSEKHVCSPAL